MTKKTTSSSKVENNFLWDLLKSHIGHTVEIAIYGNPENPDDICLEDIDTNEVILDAGIYTVVPRDDAEDDE